MGNKEIANQFNLLGKLMELHGENPFKTRSYLSAYNTLRRFPNNISEMSEEELLELPGIGKAIQAKINELLETGNISNLVKYLELTPPGIVQIMKVKGLGVKKIKLLWKELDVESPGELLYACRENRLIELKGFGEKTQADVIEQLEYLIASQGKHHFATVYPISIDLEKQLFDKYPKSRFSLIGQMLRKCQIIDKIDLVGTLKFEELELEGLELKDDMLYFNDILFDYKQVSENDFVKTVFKLSCHPEYFKAFGFKIGKEENENEIYKSNSLPFHSPEIREPENIKILKKEKLELNLVKPQDIKGVIHNHTNYSDGVNTIEEMANETHQLGYEYISITDHSKSAFYANGLQPERLLKQLEEIKVINKNAPIKIFSGIESDILSNGSLDYDNEILNQLDLVVASVHSVLKMDKEKATNRVIKAIEDPHTRILGHPSGRLLLSRKGYPLDYEKVIDACAANNVVLEINANPYRLDLDWRYISKAMEKGVLLSINPDAHSIGGIKDIFFGVCAARKGMLTIESTLNSKTLSEFEAWINSK